MTERMGCRFIKDLALDDEGQGTVEYILLLSASVLAAVQLSRKMIGILDTGVLRLGAQLEQDLKTGRAPLSVWKN